mmetsp:Transcript_20056/g.47824  ORF Transcript_20056/g.47824 Transcript_20056/m.47824 type:complete len:280 (-) Transcript_20056:252-1091(-)
MHVQHLCQRVVHFQRRPPPRRRVERQTPPPAPQLVVHVVDRQLHLLLGLRAAVRVQRRLAHGCRRDVAGRGRGLERGGGRAQQFGLLRLDPAERFQRRQAFVHGAFQAARQDLKEPFETILAVPCLPHPLHDPVLNRCADLVPHSRRVQEPELLGLVHQRSPHLQCLVVLHDLRLLLLPSVNFAKCPFSRCLLLDPKAAEVRDRHRSLREDHRWHRSHVRGSRHKQLSSILLVQFVAVLGLRLRPKLLRHAIVHLAHTLIGVSSFHATRAWLLLVTLEL